MTIETKLKYQKRGLVQKIENKGIFEKSCRVLKSPIKTASPFSLEDYQTFPNLFIVENTKLII